MKIKVTQNHIDRGKQASFKYAVCPVCHTHHEVMVLSQYHHLPFQLCDNCSGKYFVTVTGDVIRKETR